jgi:hypothetical protein
MRILWELFTVFVGIGVIFAIGKGFPGFGRILLHPFGWILSIALLIWIIILRNRAAARRAARQDST